MYMYYFNHVVKGSLEPSIFLFGGLRGRNIAQKYDSVQ